jgi:dsRNA-specific ribonuclease
MQLCLELKNLYSLQVNIHNLITATQTPSYDINDNFEALETLGDSVLKYLVTEGLVLEGGESESIMTL